MLVNRVKQSDGLSCSPHAASHCCCCWTQRAAQSHSRAPQSAYNQSILPPLFPPPTLHTWISVLTITHAGTQSYTHPQQEILGEADVTGSCHSPMVLQRRVCWRKRTPVLLLHPFMKQHTPTSVHTTRSWDCLHFNDWGGDYFQGIIYYSWTIVHLCWYSICSLCQNCSPFVQYQYINWRAGKVLNGPRISYGSRTFIIFL